MSAPQAPFSGPAVLTDAPLALPDPMDALAAAACLAVMHHNSEHATTAAVMLRAYALRHLRHETQKREAQNERPA